ncbi:MAG: CatA-like O-acetyltransferase [Flavobacteriaceae bacterium]|nr:CatA-like O-acetyltransferase [Flavobacteriaceae bacterium]
MKKIDLNTWKRKVHFQFFKNFDEPFHSLTAEVEVTKAFRFCKIAKINFFDFYLHACLKAVNDLEAFRYRISKGEVFLLETIHVSATLPKPDGTFRFSYVDFDADFSVFRKNISAEKKRILAQDDLFPPKNDDAVIHFSALPWVQFTALSHARDYSIKDSVPKISVGKINETNNLLKMPVSVTVHHGLADGKDVGEFLEKFQFYLEELGAR